VEEAVALADRIIVLANGSVALNLHVDLPRPRDHASRGFTEIKKAVLDTVLGVRQADAARVHALEAPEAVVETGRPRLVRTA
jgi:sulfonate transport system ATP-binding protein